METHRYVRKNLVQTGNDRYDLNLCSTKQTNSTATSLTTEYWTNGTTTLLAIPTKPVNSLTQSFSNPRTSTPKPHRVMASAPSSTSNSQNSMIKNSLLSGSVAGMASTLTCYPMDVLRVKMQSTALVSGNTGGVFGTFRNTLQYGGVRALYTGLTIPLAAQAVYKGTVFTVNKITEQAIKDWKTLENHKLGNFTDYKLNTADRFFSGCMGGAVNATLFVTPVEFVRNAQISQMSQQGSGPQPGPLEVIRSTVRSKGVTGLWRGLIPTALRDSLGCGCFFATMAYTQNYLSRREDEMQDDPPNNSVLVLSGAVAGLGFWTVGLPLDTMKTWIQNGSAKNLEDAWRLSQKDGFVNGIVSLNRGWQVAYGRGAPAAAITVTTYSLVFAALNQET